MALVNVWHCYIGANSTLQQSTEKATKTEEGSQTGCTKDWAENGPKSQAGGHEEDGCSRKRASFIVRQRSVLGFYKGERTYVTVEMSGPRVGPTRGREDVAPVAVARIDVRICVHQMA